jgi:glutamyl-tRNA reductase
MSAPRDVDPEIGKLKDVFLHTVDGFRQRPGSALPIRLESAFDVLRPLP